MAYNRWLQHNHYELYHYGVKGMRWHHHKNPLQTAYNALGGSAEQEFLEAQKEAANIDINDREGRQHLFEAETKWLTSPVGRVKNFRRRMREFMYDVVLDGGTAKEKVKAGASWLKAYLKEG